jgi:hypothetical protein
MPKKISDSQKQFVRQVLEEADRKRERIDHASPEEFAEIQAFLKSDKVKQALAIVRGARR